MPRKGKGKKKRRRRRNPARENAVANFWSERIRAAREDPSRKRYIEEGNRIVKSFRAHHTESFDMPSVREHFLDLRGAAAVSVPKAAQARNSLGPHLYPENPTRNVVALGTDTVRLGLARVLSKYINYTPKEANLKRHLRSGINDSALRGRGFGFTGWNPTKEIVTSWKVRSIDVLVDPDVDEFDDAEWVAIRHREPIWRTKRRIKDRGESWRIKGLKPNCRRPSGNDEDELEESEQRNSPTNDLVEYYVVYSKMGIGPVKGADQEDFRRYDDKFDWVRLEIQENHHFPLAEGEWEFPIYLDEDWPLVPLDLIEPVEEQWPTSILGQVDSPCRTLDLLGSAWVNGVKERARVLVAGEKSLDPKVHDRIKNGGMCEYIALDDKPGIRMQDRIHAFGLGTPVPDMPVVISWLERQVEATTGVSPMLHGAQTDDAVDRSATASRNRAEASNARVSDMRSRVEEWQTTLARHEAIMVRLTLTDEEVTRYVKADDIQLLCVEVMVPGGAMLPVRDRRDDEERKQDEAEGREPPITLEYIGPRFSTYYEAEEEAAQAALDVWEAIKASDDPRVVELARSLGQEQRETGLPDSIQIKPVTAEDVWRDTAGMTSSEMMRELSYEIEAGSFPRMDKDREVELAQDEMQQVLPVALNTGDMGMAQQILKHRDDALEVPPEKRLPLLQPPPPPSPEGAPA